MFSRRSLRNVALAEREKRARSRLPPPADFHSPRSTDSSNSFSSASIFMVGVLTEVLLRGLPAWDDRLQEHRVLVLDERHQVHVVLALDDEDALAGVPVGVRVFQDVEQVATLDVENDVLEPDAATRLELRVLGVVPGEVLQCCQVSGDTQAERNSSGFQYLMLWRPWGEVDSASSGVGWCDARRPLCRRIKRRPD